MIFLFFFLPFQQGVAVAFFPVIGVTMTKGYGSAPLLVLGAEWRFRLVDCEKMLFMGEWWHVYWACQINRSNELSQDKNNTHADRDGGGIETETCFGNPPDPEMHQSNTDLCVTLGFSEGLQSCLTSELLGECVVWILPIPLCRWGSIEKRRKKYTLKMDAWIYMQH